MIYDCPYKLRVWTGKSMMMVQTVCFNERGALWYGAGAAFGWAWVNDAYEGWTKDDPKPSSLDVAPVMRWTGHKDIDGKDIYEGDIVSWCNGEATLVIQYCEEYARFGGLVVLQRDEEVENDSFQWFDDYGMPYKIKVIGNVHQTPELLKT